MFPDVKVLVLKVLFATRRDSQSLTKAILVYTVSCVIAYTPLLYGTLLGRY